VRLAAAVKGTYCNGASLGGVFTSPKRQRVDRSGRRVPAPLHHGEASASSPFGSPLPAAAAAGRWAGGEGVICSGSQPRLTHLLASPSPPDPLSPKRGEGEIGTTRAHTLTGGEGANVGWILAEAIGRKLMQQWRLWRLALVRGALKFWPRGGVRDRGKFQIPSTKFQGNPKSEIRNSKPGGGRWEGFAGGAGGRGGEFGFA
jgi:hypothetical protein